MRIRAARPDYVTFSGETSKTKDGGNGASSSKKDGPVKHVRKKFELVADKKSGGAALEKISGLDGRERRHVAPFVTSLSDTPECLLVVSFPG